MALYKLICVSKTDHKITNDKFSIYVIKANKYNK